jgi:hypothetical protein
MAKKIFFVSLILLVVSASAFAGEGSDTIGACKLLPQLRYSYYEADMSLNRDTIPSVYDNLDWRKKVHTATLQVNYGIIDNLDVFAFVGARLAGEKSAEEMTVGRGERDFRFDLGSGFTCGVGVKGTFYRMDNGLYFGGGAAFEYSANTKIRDLETTFGGITRSDDDSGLHWADSDYTIIADLHAGWAFKKIGLTPYVGVEYLWNREYMKLIEFDNKYTGSTDTPVGVYVGLDYLVNDRIYFNAEGHMIDRWGGSVSVGLLFDLCEKPAPAPAPVPAPVIEPKLEPMSLK